MAIFVVDLTRNVSERLYNERVFGFFRRRTRILSKAERFVLEGRLERAIDEYSKLQRKNGDDPTILNTVGDLLLRVGRDADALAYFRKVAEIYLRDGFLLKAIAMFKKISQLDPADMNTRTTLADLFERQGLFFDAVAEYRHLCRHYQDAGQLRGAIDASAKLCALGPGDPESHRILIGILEQDGNLRGAAKACAVAGETLGKREPEVAFEFVSRGLQYEPDNRRLLERLVDLAMNGNRLGEATEILRGLALAAGTQFPYSIYTALALERQGRKEEAGALYSQLRQEGHSDPLIDHGLARTGWVIQDSVAGRDLSSFLTEPGEDEASSFEGETSGLFSFDIETSSVFPEPGPSVPEADEESQSDLSEASPRLDFRVAGSPEISADEEVPLQEALEEVDFYLKLGFKQDARKLLEKLLARHPGEEPVLRRAVRAGFHVPELDQVRLPEPDHQSSEHPLESEQTSHDIFEGQMESALEELFQGEVGETPEVLRYSVQRERGENGVKASIHYDLGLAYKEMGLVEDGIREFEKSFELAREHGEVPQQILCCGVLAGSYISLSKFKDAEAWARRGLDNQELKDFEWKALQYDLASAAEGQGTPEAARRILEEIATRDPDFRDVGERLQRLVDMGE